jgi:endonuclease/exonuclease/phosphatase (EEP) superfamily protein YafD
MEELRRQCFKKIFTELYHHFPGRFKNSRELDYLFNSYLNELADVPIEKIVEAARTHIRTSDHFPFLCELLPKPATNKN